MHGNVWEWVLDKYDDFHYNKCGSVCTDHANLTDGSNCMARGGSRNSNGQGGWRSAARNYYSPGNRYNYVGFRLVRSVRQ